MWYPKKNENVKLIVYDSKNKTQNKEYVGPTISRPTKYDFQNYGQWKSYIPRKVRELKQGLT